MRRKEERWDFQKPDDLIVAVSSWLGKEFTCSACPRLLQKTVAPTLHCTCSREYPCLEYLFGTWNHESLYSATDKCLQPWAVGPLSRDWEIFRPSLMYLMLLGIQFKYWMPMLMRLPPNHILFFWYCPVERKRGTEAYAEYRTLDAGLCGARGQDESGRCTCSVREQPAGGADVSLQWSSWRASYQRAAIKCMCILFLLTIVQR